VVSSLILSRDRLFRLVLVEGGLFEAGRVLCLGLTNFGLSVSSFSLLRDRLFRLVLVEDGLFKIGIVFGLDLTDFGLLGVPSFSFALPLSVFKLPSFVSTLLLLLILLLLLLLLISLSVIAAVCDVFRRLRIPGRIRSSMFPLLLILMLSLMLPLPLPLLPPSLLVSSSSIRYDRRREDNTDLLLLESRLVLSLSIPLLLVYFGVMLFLLLLILGEDNSFFGVNI